ncbi:MAG: 7-cyano-7-deazaguanine synthase QueC [Bdellovibrionales bacterium]|nr:7-cyano-7-deazaguanine synthase QueC [Bdellovibrionales bacterium]
MKNKSIVLFSGGLDSSVNLYSAVQSTKVVLALTFNYGQRAFKKELETTQYFCERLNIQHQVVDLPWLQAITNTSLVRRDNQVPTGSAVQIDDLNRSFETARAVWVPNRNGIFLNIAAAFAEALCADEIVVGFNSEEAQTFPDNSAAYLESLNQCFKYSTATKVKVKCYTLNMNKTEIAQLGQSLKLPFAKIWPCYFAKEVICGECESCQRFNRALLQAGVKVEV